MVLSPFMTRRNVLAGLSAGLLPAADVQERYRLGVMATMFASLPLDDAITRIRRSAIAISA
jgi:hypothetical protein